ncbi:MAG TPA: hypothetical protein VMF69_26040 [Gemmataceae bacterium]|nr:hypothetical protein [Gemmataceae bacterium]
MAEQRSLVNSVCRADVLSPTCHEAEPIVKGEPASGREQETGRTLSEPSILKIAAFGSKGDSPTRSHVTRPEVPKDVATYRAFRRLCDNIVKELGRIGAFLIKDKVSDEGAEVVAEIEALLEELYTCPHGQGESLKRVVVAVQSQVNNTVWDRRHIEFLRDLFFFLRVRYLVDEAAVDTCYDFMKARGLDPFRGTICEPRVTKRYRIEEVLEHDKSSGTIS